MPRLFAALRPPEDIREQLLDLMEGVPDARWQDDEQLHLTLRFVGEVDGTQAEDVALALDGIRFPAFDLSLAGVGQFGRRGRLDSLWAGVTPRDAVAALHAKVDRAVVTAGLEPDRRAFLPHVTLARFSRGSDASAAAFLARHAALASPSFRIDRFGLYESRLSRHGARYEAVAEWPLAARERFVRTTHK